MMSPEGRPIHDPLEGVDLSEHLQLVLDAGGLGTWRWTKATGRVEWDDRLCRLFGYEPGAFDGSYESWSACLHPEDRDEVHKALEAATAARGRYVVEHRVVWPDGSVHWVSGAGQVTVEDGEVTGTIGCVADVTERVLADRARDELTRHALEAAEHERLNRERLEFLGRINDALAASVTRRQVMESVTRTAVPRLGDWCAIHVLPDPEAGPGQVPDVEVANVDPSMVDFVLGLQERFPYDPESSTGVAHVIRTGETEFFPEVDDALLESVDAPEEAIAIVRDLRLRSAITVPLEKRGRVIGAIQFVMTDARRRYTDEDVALIHAVAARIASSLENLRLMEHQRLIAATLQEALLPDEIPAVDGVDAAVRYRAAGEGTKVGGDFYDLFAVGDGQWAAVVGDVCGSGPVAASLTATARHSIRMSAWHGDRPAEVLCWLNRALFPLDGSRFCTAAYVDLRPGTGGVDVEVAVGGHPLPVVVRAGGGTGHLGRPGTLLGSFEEISCQPCTDRLRPGDVLVLYTDGITDLPPPHDISDDELSAMVAAAAEGASSADEVAERLLASVEAVQPIGQRVDDMALLVLMVRP